MKYQKCDVAVRVDNVKTDWVDAAWGLIADYRVTVRSDCDLLCLDTAGYVRMDRIACYATITLLYEQTTAIYIAETMRQTVLLAIRKCISL